MSHYFSQHGIISLELVERLSKMTQDELDQVFQNRQLGTAVRMFARERSSMIEKHKQMGRPTPKPVDVKIGPQGFEKVVEDVSSQEDEELIRYEFEVDEL